MAKFVDIKKFEEENKGLKNDLEMLQDILNRIDCRMRFLCNIDGFSCVEEKSVYDAFCKEKLDCERFFSRLKDINELYNKELSEILIEDEMFNNRLNDWR